DPAAILDRMAGIYQQVHENLAQSGRITEDGRNILIQLGCNFQLSIIWLMFNEFQGFQKQHVDVHTVVQTVRFSAEIEQTADNPFTVVSLPDNDLKIFRKVVQPAVGTKRGFVTEAAQKRLCIAGDRGERIVDFMGNSGGQHSNTRHFFGLDQLHFMNSFQRHIPHKNKSPGFLSKLVLYGVGRVVDIPGAAFPYRNHGCLYPLAVQSKFNRATIRRKGHFRMKNIPAPPSGKNLLREKLRTDVIEMLDRAVMIKDDDTIVNRVKYRLQFVFLVAQPDLVLFALGYVLSCAIEPYNLFGNVDRRLHDRVDPFYRAVPEQQTMLNIIVAALLYAASKMMHNIFKIFRMNQGGEHFLRNFGTIQS